MILFVDDESREMDSYKRELEIQFSLTKIIFKDDIDEAWRFYLDNKDELKLVLLDIMMPSGKLFKNSESQDGLRTGVKFFEKLRAEQPKLKIILLTNVSDKYVADRFNTEPNCYFFLKENFLPFELADEIKQILNL